MCTSAETKASCGREPCSSGKVAASRSPGRLLLSPSIYLFIFKCICLNRLLEATPRGLQAPLKIEVAHQTARRVVATRAFSPCAARRFIHPCAKHEVHSFTRLLFSPLRLKSNNSPPDSSVHFIIFIQSPCVRISSPAVTVTHGCVWAAPDNDKPAWRPETVNCLFVFLMAQV